jgi:hypothetical protein
MRRHVVMSVLVLAAGVAGCSNSTRLEGKPQWSLTGGREQLPPPAPATAQTPQYKGGRDPVTGRAPPYSMPSDRVERVPLGEPRAAGSVAALPAGTSAALDAGKHNGRPVIEVRPGDSLASIAREHRVAIASLMFANGLRDAYVYPGQKLVLPPR